MPEKPEVEFEAYRKSVLVALTKYQGALIEYRRSYEHSEYALCEMKHQLRATYSLRGIMESEDIKDYAAALQALEDFFSKHDEAWELKAAMLSCTRQQQIMEEEGLMQHLNILKAAMQKFDFR